MTRKSDQSSLVIGLVIIAAGALLLLRNLNVLPFIGYFHFLFSWKMILFVIGLILFFISANRLSGVVLMVLGIFFLIPDIFGVPISQLWKVGLPLILVFAGILILVRKGFDPEKYHLEKGTYDLDYINEFILFGGAEKKFDTQSFRGGKATVIFGGLEISISGTSLAEGRNIVDLMVVFGGATIYLPEHWNVKTSVVSILGGFSDSRQPDRIKVEDSSQELVIKGLVLFGGGEIKALK